MISSEQEEELESLPFLYTEEELIILNRDPVHIQIRVESIPEGGGSPMKALLDINWGEKYPSEKPEISIISIDIKDDEKELIVQKLLDACDDALGMAMTFVLSSNLSQLLTEHHDNMLNQIQSATPAENVEETSDKSPISDNQTKGITTQAKTKAQKRQEQNNWSKAGEMPRGYNWVDVVNHLRKV